MYEAKQCKEKVSRRIDGGSMARQRNMIENFKKLIIQKTPHTAETYQVEIQHIDANSGNPVFYYRDNVIGHRQEHDVIQSAMNHFMRTYGPLVGAPDRRARSVRTVSNGAIPI